MKKKMYKQLVLINYNLQQILQTQEDEKIDDFCMKLV